MEIKYEDDGKRIIINDYDNLDFYNPSEEIKETSPLNNPILINSLDYEVDVLEPSNDGCDFLIKRVGEIFKNITKCYNHSKLKNRSYGDVFPLFKEIMYPYFKNAYNYSPVEDFEIYFYKQDNLEFLITVSIIYENDEIFVLTRNKLFDIDDDNSLSQIKQLQKKIIVQNESFVKFNNSFSDFLETVNIPKDEFSYKFVADNSEILNNSIEEDLSFDEIINYIKLENKKIVDFTLYLDVYDITLHIKAQKVLFNNKIAIELAIIDELDNTDIIEKFIEAHADKTHFNKSSIILYNTIDEVYQWPHEIYELLEIDAPSPDDYKNNLIKDYIFKEDFEDIHKAYKKISPENPDVEYNFRVSTNHNNVKYLHCNLFAIYNENKHLEKILYFLNEITDYDLMNENLKILNDNLNILQSISNSALCYKNVNGDYIWTNNFFNIVEYSEEEFNKKPFKLEKLIIDKDKIIFDKTLESLTPEKPSNSFKVRIRTKNNNLKYIEVFIRNFYDKDGKILSSTFSIHDISHLIKIERDNYKLISAFDTVDAHLKTAIIFENYKGNLQFSKIFWETVGIEANRWENGGKNEFVNNMVNKEDYLKQHKLFSDKKSNEMFLDILYKYKGDENQIKILKFYLNRTHNNISGYVRDITDTKKREITLEKLNNEKSILLKEVHHRVKNNLQVLNSLLNLEERAKERDSDEILESIKNRIASMALIHELTYGSKNLESVNLKKYFEIYDSQIFGFNRESNIRLESHVEENVDIPMKLVTALILIINELTSNSIKYAFDYEDNENDRIITKSLKIVGENCILEYKDNGKGISEEFDIFNCDGLGWTIISSLIKQLEGEVEQIESEGLGFKITFPIKEQINI